MSNSYFFQDRPLFGLDIGFRTLKVMQVAVAGKRAIVSGYGTTAFKSSCIEAGVIVNPQGLAESMHSLFNNQLVGSLTTRRVALAVPSARTFNRSMTLPRLDSKDILNAVRLETEQYIPLPLDQLYLDYAISTQNETDTDLLVVAIPQKIVDSYLVLAELLNLEVVAIETSIGAVGRLFVQAEESDVPTILIDFGSMSADITIYDGGLIVTGTVACGGDLFTETIAKKLALSQSQAQLIKTKYGLELSKKQAQIIEALTPVLEQLAREIRRMVRYYEDRGNRTTHIGQVVTMGGGANMPGLSDFLTNLLRLPVRMCDPWHNLDFADLQPPSAAEKSMYVTAAGLSLISPKEVLQ